MAKTLAELRAESASRPEADMQKVDVEVLLSAGRPHVDRVLELTDELNRIAADAAKAPRKTGEGTPPAVTQAQEAVNAAIAAAEDYKGMVTVAKTMTNGEWAEWRAQHPAREVVEGTVPLDTVTGGWCNADDLMAELSRFVVAWNGEQLGEGDFDMLDISRPDLKDMARIVTTFYEVSDEVPKSLSGLSMLLAASGTSSPSPTTSGSASDDSSATNQPSDTNTSTPTAT